MSKAVPVRRTDRRAERRCSVWPLTLAPALGAARAPNVKLAERFPSSVAQTRASAPIGEWGARHVGQPILAAAGFQPAFAV